MTISTARLEAARARRPRGGFSILELLIAMSISSMALAAVLATVIFIARSTVSTTDYADMDREARTGLEIFARDVRMAQKAKDFTANEVTLEVVNTSGTTNVNYSYVPATRTFYRAYGTPGQRALISNIDSFALTFYSIGIDTDTGLQQLAKNPLEAKQIQLALRSVRTGPAKAFASNNVVSARYILRNKLER